MTRREKHRSGRYLVGFAVAVLTPALIAQEEGVSGGEFAAATLPESNEALLLSSRVQAAMQAGDHRLAIELIDRLMDLSDGLVAAPASRTCYPVWREALRLMAELPPEAIELYRQLHDAEVTARFAEAAGAADVSALRELFRRYRLSSAWRAIGVELAARLLDDGMYGGAIEVLGEMSQPRRYAGAGNAPELRAQLAAALASAGAVGRAERLLGELGAEAELRGQVEWRDRLEQLNRWLATLRTDVDLHGGGGAFSADVTTGAVWTQALAGEAWDELAEEGEDIAEAVALLRRLPLEQAVLTSSADGGLIVRQRGWLWALDAETLLVRWGVGERVTIAAPAVRPTAAAEGDRGLNRRLPEGVQLLMSDYLGHAVSVGFGNVYTVEARSAVRAELDAFGRGPFGVAGEPPRRNELAARELESGRVVWRAGAEPADPLFDVAFQNVPLAVGDMLVAPIVRGEELRLAVIDPSDGRLLREVLLVGPPNKFPSEGGRCLMISDETTLYVCTGNGIIAALARDDLSWKWATAYPSMLAERLGQLWWQPPKKEQQLSIDAPVIADDLLIVAPVDSDPPAVFALDRFGGREHWRMSRREYPFLVGAVSRGLVVAGHALACLDLSNPAGRPSLWKSVPLQITGRPAIRAERIYVPTREGVVVLDGRTGKVLADQIEAETKSAAAAAAPDRTANLLVGDDALFSVSANRVVKYPDLRRTRARYAAAEPGGPYAGERKALVMAWLDALAGRYAQALAGLQARVFDDPQLAAARKGLLEHLFLELAREAPAGEDRLAWLRRAWALADSPDAAARLALTIGRALEAGGRWAEALHQYREVLCGPGLGCVGDGPGGHRRAAAWLHAAERIRVIRAERGVDRLEELLAEALRESEGGPERAVKLQRLRVALTDEPARTRVDRLLAFEKLSPEVKVGYLPEGAATDLSSQAGRRLHLERWEVDVSLGLLDRARADRALWERGFGRSEARTPEQVDGLATTRGARMPAEEERERVELIELAFRKLAQSSGSPFRREVVRQWKIARAELLLDERRPLAALAANGGRYVLVADLRNRRIALVDVYKHQHAQRQTEDGLAGERQGAQRPSGFGTQSSWPVIVYEHLAAVPVVGGLVCVGLGPERYGGRRQWEYAVPQWEGVPADFGARSAAGPDGVYFSPRRDRVALVGWFDGQLRWERELKGVRISRLYLIDEGEAEFDIQPSAKGAHRAEGGRLVIVGEDQRVWVTDATFGRELRRVESGVRLPRRVDVVGATIVVWGAESVAGVDGQTLEPVWNRPCGLVEDSVTVPGQPWIAYRVAEDPEWHLLDVRAGEAAFERPLGAFDSISAIVADGDRLFVAGRAGGAGEGAVRVAAIRLADGAPLWSREFVTRVALNATQLAAHPTYIPILLVGLDGDRGAAGATGLPAIQLLSKLDGEASEPLPMKEDYRPAAEVGCEMYMLVTPTRMVVQAGGNLIAYGNSPLRPAP